jgi:hypothetical protein
MQHHWSALALLCLLVQNSANGPRADSSPTDKPLTLAQVWTLDATYKDPTHGVTFRYPSVWRPTTELAYHAPALEHSFAPPITEFAYDGFHRDRGQNIGPYSSTNLEAVGILYSAIDAASATECKTRAASLSDHSDSTTVVISGRRFSVFGTGDEGMSQSISGDLYATYANHTCYLFETDLALADEQAVDLPGLTTAQLRYIFAHLESIMKSVRIASRR